MEESALLFYLLSFVIVTSAILVLVVPNPIYAALSLAGSMIGLGFMYFQLQAYFIAGVQLIVYAGAVMVLFVMVLMLFDLKKEHGAEDQNALSLIVKLVSGLFVSAIIFWSIRESIEVEFVSTAVLSPEAQGDSVKALAGKLFTHHVFAFEVLGILLLIIAVGVVAVSRTKGGTHARD